jgi:hypothetical protein
MRATAAANGKQPRPAERAWMLRAVPPRTQRSVLRDSGRRSCHAWAAACAAGWSQLIMLRPSWGLKVDVGTLVVQRVQHDGACDRAGMQVVPASKKPAVLQRSRMHSHEARICV